jgi:RimJ/RimL family protein N-acetyltransferase
MITRISRAAPDLIQRVADFVFENPTFMRLAFLKCNAKEEVAAALKESGERWNVLVAEKPNAVFSLHTSEASAIVDQFIPEAPESIDATVTALVSHLKPLKIETITIGVPEDATPKLASVGFEKRNTFVRLSGRVIETKLMQILPLTNPLIRDIPTLAKLMHESFGKNTEMEVQSMTSAEKTLRDIIGGFYGKFMPECSFVSGTAGNPVSACFITYDSPHSASVAELFTHPLYRARGLATTEISTGMNRLLKLGFMTLSIWVSEDNEVAKRLFSKLGFREDGRLVQMTARAK